MATVTERQTLIKTNNYLKKRMDIPAVCLLLLEQGDHPLKDHTRDFLDLVCFTLYPNSLLSFSKMPVSTSCRRLICPWKVFGGASELWMSTYQLPRRGGHRQILIHHVAVCSTQLQVFFVTAGSTQFQVSLIMDGSAQLQASLVTAGFAQLQVSHIVDGPAQPHSPSSSARAIQFFGHVSTVSLQPLGSSVVPPFCSDLPWTSRSSALPWSGYLSPPP